MSRRPTAAAHPTARCKLRWGQYVEVQARLAKNPKAGAQFVLPATGLTLAQHCICRTTLVPKLATPILPSDFRPVVASKVSPRLLTRFLSQRWSRLCPTTRYQFGFQERDGTAETTSLLHGILRHAISAPRSIVVAVLDVTKAFDSVNHGDPLCPLLFNCALSEAITYSDQQLGFDMAWTTVDSIAYADDLALFAKSPLRFQQRLDGLANNLTLAKCASFYVRALGQKKSACLRPCEVSIRRSPLNPRWYAGWAFKSTIEATADLVLCAEDSLSVVDIVVAGEDLMEIFYAETVHHYSTADVQENLRRILDRPTDFPISHESAILLSRGALHPRSEARLRLLGRSKLHFSDLCLMVVRGSLKAYDIYMHGAGGIVNS
ncbi:unnamed protein product [Schistocephalus solidus]|uniref:Reverse transcriptase domain-containing protein n=1 Tax=Schistocephalus solidus TaxID=70667 RepID=A0A183TIK7_SCHSO|nr:unnamed protein product [Schistocephalus solidus]